MDLYRHYHCHRGHHGFWVDLSERGWGRFGTWFFLLIITVLIAEILVGIAMLVGAFTGIQKYNEARRIVANGNQMIAELYTTPMQQMPGTQRGGTAWNTSN